MAEQILRLLNRKTCQLSVVLTTNKDIQKLNRTYRHKNKPTNVLSFPMYEKGEIPRNGLILLGDVVLSEETIIREAKELKIPFATHFWTLFVHGVLHLFGYDHETDAEETAMNRKTTEIVTHLLAANKNTNK